MNTANTPPSVPKGLVADLDRLAHHIADHGFDRLPLSLDRIVTAARCADASPELITLVQDTTAPEIARARAFGLIASTIVQSRDPATQRRRVDGLTMGWEYGRVVA